MTDTADEHINVEVADNVVLRVQRSAVSSVLPKGTLKTL